jgi:3-dehydroquinate dehydratase II
MRILVLNGVNLDVLSRRDAAVYGGMGLGELESKIYQWARDHDSSAQCKQTNDEGEFINWIHEAYDWADGVIVNPGAWTHYSYAIRDALELFEAPVVEVHLSNVDGREDWRKVSVISDLAAHRIVGKGPDGYKEAIEWLSRQASANA